jgi:hypothetical protein
MTIRFPIALGACALVLASSSATAQSPTGLEPPPTIFPTPKRDSIRENLISTDPLGVVFQFYNAELEHAISPEFSLAAHASYFRPTDIGYTSFDLLARYYPNAEGLRGFDIGGTVGYTHLTTQDYGYAACIGCGPSYSNNANNAFTLGIQGDYSWILGPSQHFGIELGLGAKRLFYRTKGRGSDALPTARLSIGYAW